MLPTCEQKIKGTFHEVDSRKIAFLTIYRDQPSNDNNLLLSCKPLDKSIRKPYICIREKLNFLLSEVKISIHQGGAEFLNTL